MPGQSVKEGLAMKKTLKGGNDKGWKQRYLVLKLDSLEYWDKKQKKCLGNVEICSATVEPLPGARDPSKTLQIRMAHPAWQDGGKPVELFLEFNDEDQFRSWKKELDRAVVRKSVPGGRGDGHLGWRKHDKNSKQSWSSRDSSSGGGSTDKAAGGGVRRKKKGGDSDEDD